jgi:general stress protein 26
VSIQIPQSAKDVITSGRLAHLTTVHADGRPHTTIVWVDLDGENIVIGKMMPDQKVANITRDPRVSLSIEADGTQWPAELPRHRRNSIRDTRRSSRTTATTCAPIHRT